MSLFRRREPLLLRFQQREAVLIAQTPTLWALHADVCCNAVAPRGPVAITDARLDWEVGAGRKTVRIASWPWDRAVIDSKYHYPIEALDFPVGPAVSELTLTFDKDLIRRPDGPPPSNSRLVLRLMVSGADRPIERPLWRVDIAAWDRPAALRWLPQTR